MAIRCLQMCNLPDNSWIVGFEVVIEANRRRTWTINSLIGHLDRRDETCPITRLGLIRS
jgi:hypothetical protein